MEAIAGSVKLTEQNAAVAILPAAILAEGKCIIDNIPDRRCTLPRKNIN